MTDMRTVPLGRQIGSGGEGTVFEITGRPNDVAKIYHTPLSGVMAEKLKAMVAMDPGPLARQAAWPRQLLHDPARRIAGFIMDRATEALDVHEVYSPRDRVQKLPGADWAFLVRVAQNISIAFAAAHQQGIVIGDVNHGSVRVSGDGRVRLIDCDSMQVTAGGKVLRCLVGVDTYTPPELQGLRLGEIDRTPDHDAFGLAVLIFHLLFLGRHPFAGVPLSKTAPSDIAGAIKAGAYAYTASPRLLRPPPNAPGPDLVTQDVGSLFEAAFAVPAPGQPPARPSARAWHDRLGELAATIRVCGRNTAHHFSSAAGKCPWCAAEDRGIVFFVKPATDARPLVTTVDRKRLRHVWGQIEDAGHRIEASLCSHPLGTTSTSRQFYGMFGGPPTPRRLVKTPAPQPLVKTPAPPPRRGARVAKRLTDGLAWLLSLVWLMLSLWHLGFLAGLPVTALSIVIARALLRKRLAAEAEQHKKNILKIRSVILPSCETQLHELMGQARLRHQTARKIAAKIKNLSKLPIQQTGDLKMTIYLEKFSIRPGLIAGIGASRVAQLQSFGIETAADIAAKALLQVPGFGPSLIDRLIIWRRGHEKRFKFDPKTVNDPRIIARMNEQKSRIINDKSRTLQRDYETALGALVTDLQRLEVLENTIEARKSAILPMILKENEAIAQVEADKALLRW